MNIADSKIYVGDRYVTSVFLGDRKLKYGSNGATRARYVRESMAYSLVNGNQDIVRTFIELEAIDVEGDNVALGKPVTVQPGYTVYGGSGDASTLTDGNKSRYFSLLPQDKQLAWCQIDLGKVYELEAINVWHYPDGRTFKTKVEISEDGSKWKTIFDSDVDGVYSETSAGKVHRLAPADWTYPKNGFRYVRDYVKGNSDGAYGKEKHWLEIQVLDARGFNLAQGRPVTPSPGYTVNTGAGEITVVTDGNTQLDGTRDYMQLLPSDGNWSYLEVDLGKIFKPSEIKRWHYTKANWKYKSKVMVSADGVKWFKVFDTSLDGEYVDTPAGHTIKTNYKDPTIYKALGIRFIRDWLRTSNVDGYKTWVEIAAINSQNRNVALRTSVAVSPGFTVVGGVKEEVTDGMIDRYIDVQPPNSMWAHITVDMGQVHPDITNVTIWHFYNDGRKYTSRTEVSSDGITWHLIYSSKADGEYPETSAGHRIDIVHTVTPIAPLHFQYYSNYATAGHVYEVFFAPNALTDDMIAAIYKRAVAFVDQVGTGAAFDRNVLASAVDYRGGQMLLKVHGQSIVDNWATLTETGKEHAVNQWFADRFVD